MKKPLVITTFGLGHLRPAPGTWGSLPPVGLAAALIWSGHGPAESWWLYHCLLLGVLVFFSFACLLQGDAAEVAFGRKDPSQAVADETAAQCMPLMFLPSAALASNASIALTLALAFVAFRVMDIIKPWPARQLQKVPGGLGILIDDLFAGAYAWLIVQGAALLAGH